MHYISIRYDLCQHSYVLCILYSSESADEYTDDEDISWKVRRAAAKCLGAIVISRPEMLSKMYSEACDTFISYCNGCIPLEVLMLLLLPPFNLKINLQKNIS